jgi:hypothetical protein
MAGRMVLRKQEKARAKRYGKNPYLVRYTLEDHPKVAMDALKLVKGTGWSSYAVANLLEHFPREIVEKTLKLGENQRWELSFAAKQMDKNRRLLKLPRKEVLRILDKKYGVR